MHFYMLRTNQSSVFCELLMLGSVLVLACVFSFKETPRANGSNELEMAEEYVLQLGPRFGKQTASAKASVLTDLPSIIAKLTPAHANSTDACYRTVESLD